MGVESIGKTAFDVIYNDNYDIVYKAAMKYSRNHHTAEEITQKVFDQITRYNYVLHARYIVVSNGMQHYCCRIDYENRKITFLPEIPRYDELEQ